MKNHGSRLIFILLVVLACVWQLRTKDIKLGLDLAGGSSITYAVRDSEGKVPGRERIDKAIEVITKRVNATGLTEIYITSTQAGEIVVEMPQRTPEEIDGVQALIERNGQLEFRIRAESEYEVSQRASRNANPALYKTPAGFRWVPRSAKEVAGRANETDMLVRTPEVPLRAAWESLKASKGPDDAETVAAEKRYRDAAAAELFEGEDLARTGIQPEGGQIYVTFEFKEHRKTDFKNFTERNVGKFMAILLDGKVDSAPVIKSVLPGGGRIEGGGGAGFTQQEARDLQIVLESGSTGVKLELEREETLGASLGEVAIRRGRYSIVGGLIAVFVLILWYYRLPGIVANLALALNVLITLGALAFFRGALSLPGIAGIVLGLGMSIDANVLIFERLRDERRRGKTLAESLAAAYDNAMSAIIDGNVTALLSAFVLMFMGTGAVRGFGVTLAISLLASMFTAVWVTRCIFDYAVERRWLVRFDIGKDPREYRFDYVRNRRMFVIPSIVLMVGGVAGFVLRDDQQSKDLEFIGGQQVIVQLERAVSPETISEIVKGPAGEWKDATAIWLTPEGVTAGPRDSNRWQIRAIAPDAAMGEKYVEYLRTRLADDLMPPGITGWSVEKSAATAGAASKATFSVHTLAPVSDPAQVAKGLEGFGFAGVSVQVPEGSDGSVLAVTLDPGSADQLKVAESVRKSLRAMEKPVHLSDPMPSTSFLSPSQAERQWRTALQAVLLALVFQVIYIRVRFADYTHGFAAAIALIHDATVTMGAVALFDSLGLVYAKINLVLISAFMTLIGYSMNDTIVIFDRIRENLGRSKVIRSSTVNDAVNQTLSRSLRTACIVLATVVVMFAFSRGMGSAIEGFAWVMIVGSFAGSYSTVFIAAPVLLFLPRYSQILAARSGALLGMCVAAGIGAMLAISSREQDAYHWRLWAGIGLASILPLHFLAHLVPWLGHPNPDELVVADQEALADEASRVPGV